MKDRNMLQYFVFVLSLYKAHENSSTNPKTKIWGFWLHFSSQIVIPMKLPFMIQQLLTNEILVLGIEKSLDRFRNMSYISKIQRSGVK